ncbi:uncharacterized protein LOC112197206 [Rosa chinensis]|uniref:uncharacterized protein LOC112197206 n=1 Tax=Rosa chinensis TaxID=74649 RepID=UPI000D0961A3|nr:uncharacterized protein LOC112197206 [Rosa chinensis]
MIELGIISSVRLLMCVWDLFRGYRKFRFHNVKRVVPKSRRKAVWSAPPTRIVKINVDGSFHHLTRQGGVGFVIRDDQGVMLAGEAWPVRGLYSPEHAEILACNYALQFALDQDFGPFILETDALEVQRQLPMNGVANTSVLGRIFDDVVLLLESQSILGVKHIGRSGNTVAHQMAMYACSLRQEQFFFSAPSFLLAAIAADH